MSARVTFTVVKEFDRTWLQQLKKKVERKNNTVYVGYTGEAGCYESGASVAQVAMAHEYGTATLPARPTLIPAIVNNRDKYCALLADSLRKMLRDESSAAQALMLLGNQAAADVRVLIFHGPHVPLQAATIKRKGSSAPLLDTDLMVQSVTWELADDEHRRIDE